MHAQADAPAPTGWQQPAAGDGPAKAMDASAAPPEGTPMFVDTGSVSLRALPVDRGPVLGVLPLGSRLRSLGEMQGDYLKVQEPRGMSGFVAVRLLSTEQPL